MKKNIAMRVAAILFILTMISTCAFSTTFAKYVTSDSATDTARVAKWGVTVTGTDDSMFEVEYAKTDALFGGTLSVQSSANPKDNIVAPGTSGNVNSISITGTPEVAVEVKFVVTIDKEIKLAAGDYLDYTTGGSTTDTFNLADEYYPVLFTLVKVKDGVNTTLVTNGKLSEIKTELEDETAMYDPNTNLDVTYNISWTWAFNGNDKADTYLGWENISQVVNFTVDCTVTQID